MSEKKVKVGRKWVTQEEADQMLKPKYFDPTKKTLAILKKKGSPHFIAYQIDDIDDGDEWFISCLTVKNTSKQIMHSSTIIANDFQGSISYHEHVLKFNQFSETL
jgi:hypothetical protein